jgi:Xaa-Pro aminopeptidase
VKRGLVTLDPASPPPAERAARLDAVRAAALSSDCSAALIYGDVSRSDDIAYLTNLCIYWNEGVLAVPRAGAPAFLTKLSKRVHPWMRATSTLQDVRSGRDIAALAGDFLEGLGAGRRLGLVDRDLWPATLVRDVEAACAGAELVDLPDAVRRLRAAPSSSELERLRTTGRELAAALDAAVGRPAREAVASLERALRRAGATDVQAASELAHDGTASVDATVQHGTLWIRAARAAGGGLGQLLTEAVAATAAQLRPGMRARELAAAADSALRRRVDARLTVTSHADLATGGDLRALARDGVAAVAAGEVAVLALESFSASGRAVVAGSYLVGRAGAEPLSDAAMGGADDGGMG